MISWIQSFDILRFVGFHPSDALQAVDTMHSAIVDSAGSGFKRSFEVIWRLWNYDLLGLIEKMHGVIHVYIYICILYIHIILHVYLSHDYTCVMHQTFPAFWAGTITQDIG